MTICDKSLGEESPWRFPAPNQTGYLKKIIQPKPEWVLQWPLGRRRKRRQIDCSLLTGWEAKTKDFTLWGNKIDQQQQRLTATCNLIWKNYIAHQQKFPNTTERPKMLYLHYKTKTSLKCNNMLSLPPFGDGYVCVCQYISVSTCVNVSLKSWRWPFFL